MALETMPFSSEPDAVHFVRHRLEPHCSSFVLQPVLNGGLRPDIGIRLNGLNIPICIEVKRFKSGNQLSNLTDGIAQAAHYAATVQRPAFVAPFFGSSATDLHWDFRVPGAMLAAGQFSVGALMFSKYKPDEFFFALGGQVVIRVNGEGMKLHSNAEHLLMMKQRVGSKSWRKEAA